MYYVCSITPAISFMAPEITTCVLEAAVKCNVAHSLPSTIALTNQTSGVMINIVVDGLWHMAYVHHTVQSSPFTSYEISHQKYGGFLSHGVPPVIIRLFRWDFGVPPFLETPICHDFILLCRIIRHGFP